MPYYLSVLGSWDRKGFMIQGVIPSRVKRHFSKHFLTGRRPMQLPVQCIEQSIILDVKRPGHDVDHLPYVMPK
jgi:hypothetical protein